MPEEQRVIFHCDCNSFYASVELLRYPELRGVPVAVCGSPDDRHGIILAKNEPAKRVRASRRPKPSGARCASAPA